MTLSKSAIEYTSEERATIYCDLVESNMRKYSKRNVIKGLSGHLTKSQVTAAHTQANKKFFALGF